VNTKFAGWPTFKEVALQWNKGHPDQALSDQQVRRICHAAIDKVMELLRQDGFFRRLYFPE